MKTGISLQELATKLEIQSRQKKDYVVDTARLKFACGNDIPSVLAVEGSETERDHSGVHDIGHYAERQIGQHLGIPAKYWDSLRNDDDRKMRDLLSTVVNTHFERRPSKRMIRTWDRGGADREVRAFLSNRYRRLDNEELAQVVLPVLGDLEDVSIESCEITEQKMYIKALCPRIQADVKVGDPVQAGIVISNSEIGAGSLQISPLIFRLVCSNGMITSDAMRRFHSGRRVQEGNLDIYSRDTLRADDEAFWRVTRDHVRAAVNESRFLGHVEKLRESTEQKIEGDPAETVVLLQKELRLTDTERGGVLRHLIEGGDLSKWGLANAVTRFSQDTEDYDRATELEHAGSVVIDLPSSSWRKLAKATA